MYAKTAVPSARLLVGAAALVCTLFAGNVAAKDVMVADAHPDLPGNSHASGR